MHKSKQKTITNLKEEFLWEVNSKKPWRFSPRRQCAAVCCWISPMGRLTSTWLPMRQRVMLPSMRPISPTKLSETMFRKILTKPMEKEIKTISFQQKKFQMRRALMCLTWAFLTSRAWSISRHWPLWTADPTSWPALMWARIWHWPIWTATSTSWRAST